jgi:hypothetical protein
MTLEELNEQQQAERDALIKEAYIQRMTINKLRDEVYAQYDSKAYNAPAAVRLMVNQLYKMYYKEFDPTNGRLSVALAKRHEQERNDFAQNRPYDKDLAKKERIRPPRSEKELDR